MDPAILIPAIASVVVVLLSGAGFAARQSARSAKAKLPGEQDALFVTSATQINQGFKDLIAELRRDREADQSEIGRLKDRLDVLDRELEVDRKELEEGRDDRHRLRGQLAEARVKIERMERGL